MKTFRLMIIAIVLMFVPVMRGADYKPSAENVAARESFVNDRFGIFIHWGMYSLFGHGEWYQYKEKINYEEYAKGANAFYPHDFDAERWVDFLKSCGARYITITSRHHDGFSMWDTKQSDFKITNTPFGRDVLKELAAACEKRGMKLGFYYSHLDWHRLDYPCGDKGDAHVLGRDRSKEDWSSYYKFMNAQLTELLIGYGKVNCIWFDGMWSHNTDSVPFDWGLEEQYGLIHRLQPSCLVVNNHHMAVIPGEDVQPWERDLPGENTKGHTGMDVGHLPLETCATMVDHDNWAYDLGEYGCYMSGKELIQLLVRTAGKDANLLLNIGPRPDGNIPEEAMSRLRDMGDWLKQYGETIYGSRGGDISDGEHYVSTTKGNHIYLHFLKGGVDEVKFEVAGKVKSISSMMGEANAVVKYSQKGRTVTLEPKIVADVPDFIYDVELR